jgi:biopolymer transport protein ExbD
MSISSRKAGATVQCPTCGQQTLVPLTDAFEPQVEHSAQESVDTRAPDTELVARNPSQVPISMPQGHAPAPIQAAVPAQAPPPRQPETGPAVRAESARPSPEPPDEIDELPQFDVESEDDSGFQLRRRSRTDDDMDLTPMVDVTFQLLIFFMVTASFALQKSIEVPTPDPDKKGASQQLQILEDMEGTSIRVQIDASNTIFVDDDAVADPTRLTEVLKDKMRKEQKTEILISAHAAALHRSVISVIDAANSVGMQKIRLLSRQGKSE